MNIYIVYLRDGRKFCLESYENYQKVFNRYFKRYGDNLACVIKDYLQKSIKDIKKGVNPNVK